MRVFRIAGFLRTTAGSLILGLVLSVLSGTARAEERSLDYSSLVRLHLPGNAPESVRNALKLTEKTKAHSLEEFLDTFLLEIKRSGSENDVAEWLYGKSVNHSIVRRDLRLRLIDVVSSVVLHRSLEVAFLSPLHAKKQRVDEGFPAEPTGIYSVHQRAMERIIRGDSDHRKSRFLTLESRPRGP